METTDQERQWTRNGIPLPPDETQTDAPAAILPRPRTRSRSLLREVIETALLIVAIYTLINLLTARFIVDGFSMSPTFATGQFILVNRLSYLLAEPSRGDVVVFQSPDDPGRDFIKRVIGLPGEHIEVWDGVVYVEEIPLDEPYINAPPTYTGTWTVGPDQYFVLGDNRPNSQDSHLFGPLDRSAIIGQAWVVYWPPQDWQFILPESYDEQLPMPASTAAPTGTPGSPAP